MTISAPQLGKTIALALWLGTSAWAGGNEPSRSMFPYWWTAPTYQQCRDGFVTKFCGMMRSAGILKSNTTTPPLVAELINGVRIEARSWDRVDGMYGPTVRGIAVDEFGQLTRDAYSAISSRRAESITWGEGQIRYAGNVGEVGGVAEELWRQAESGDAGFACRTWTWRDRAAAHNCGCGNGVEIPVEIAHANEHKPGCPRGAYLVFIGSEARRMSSPQFRQLYDAEWVDWNLLPAYQFDRAIHVNAELAAYQPGLPVDLSCDFNVDPMAWILGQHRGERAWVFDEISIPGGATTAQACRVVLERLPDAGVELVVYGDRSGKSRDTKSRQTDYEIIRATLGAHYRSMRLDVPNANPAVSARLNAFNAMLAPLIGEPRYHIHPKAKHLANDLARVSLLPGTHDLDKRKKQLTHYTDADGYRVASLFPVEQPGEVYVGAPDPHWVDTDPVLGMDT